MRKATVALVAIATLTLSGCQDLAGPQWLNPGSSPEQQRRAQWFDPYPSPTMGPLDVTVRPPMYQNPPPEADARARSTRSPPGRW